MSENKVYNVFQDNLGEYSVLKGEERILICTEIEHKGIAELFCYELNDLAEENEQLKETNQELYDFRLILNALLFNEWAKTGEYEVYKSKRHRDGSIPFPNDNEDWFIVVAILPSGQVTNHYHIKYWDYFKIPSYEKVKDEFDEHTSSVVLLRYGELLE